MKDYEKTLEQLHSYSILPEKREIFLNPKDGNSETDIELAVSFIKNIRFLESISEEPILIHQYNAGGEWAAGFAIYDIIKSSPCHITMIGHGEIMSAGILILQGADDRFVLKNSQIMIHEGSSGLNESLSHRAAKSWSMEERKKEELLYEIFTEKCMNGPFFKQKQFKKNRVKGYLKTQIGKHEDWILSPHEALDFGFVDGIVGSSKYPHLNDVKKLI